MKRLLVRFGAPAAVVTLLGLALWPPVPDGDPGDTAAARLCRGKIERLARAAGAGGGADDSFSEGELNAHLARILSRNDTAREARGLTVGSEDLRLDLAPEPTFVVAARLLRVPLVFTVGLACDGGEGPPRLRTATVGHLPFPGPLKHLVTGRMRPLFARLRDEGIVWRHLVSCEVNDRDEAVTVSVHGGHLEARLGRFLTTGGVPCGSKGITPCQASSPCCSSLCS